VFLDEVTRELNMSLPADAGEQQLKDRVQGWLQARAEELFGKRLMIYAEKLGVPIAPSPVLGHRAGAPAPRMRASA
jgi:predicted metal-dependent hydrolase